MKMRPDQIKDFNKELVRFLKKADDLPRELKEELAGATNVTLQSSESNFAIQYTTDEGAVKALKFETNGSFELCKS